MRSAGFYPERLHPRLHARNDGGLGHRCSKTTWTGARRRCSAASRWRCRARSASPPSQQVLCGQHAAGNTADHLLQDRAYNCAAWRPISLVVAGRQRNLACGVCGPGWLAGGAAGVPSFAALLHKPGCKKIFEDRVSRNRAESQVSRRRGKSSRRRRPSPLKWRWARLLLCVGGHGGGNWSYLYCCGIQ